MICTKKSIMFKIKALLIQDNHRIMNDVFISKEEVLYIKGQVHVSRRGNKTCICQIITIIYSVLQTYIEGYLSQVRYTLEALNVITHNALWRDVKCFTIHYIQFSTLFQTQHYNNMILQLTGMSSLTKLISEPFTHRSRTFVKIGWWDGKVLFGWVECSVWRWWAQ